MTNILSNRFFQGGAAIAVLAIGFFAYQNFSGDDATEEVASEETAPEQEAAEQNAATAETTENVDAIEDNVENAVNNTDASDTINTTAEEATAE
mgnify:CR=1 FL=1|tara:strand:+ start:1491 stop:1772 length:282 start_codon:yes stop_codon:yes gene_type:complete